MVTKLDRTGEFIELFMNAYPEESLDGLDARVLSSMLRGIEESARWRKPRHIIDQQDFLPLLRSIRNIIGENNKLSNELVQLSNLLDRQ
jgi:fructose-bisphosphate aldolase class 1